MAEEGQWTRSAFEAVGSRAPESSADGGSPIGSDPGRLLAAIVASSDDCILSKTLDGTITSWNAGAERMYGYTAAEAIGRRVSLLIPPERDDDTVFLMARLRRGERIRHYETVRMARDGRRLAVALTISPLRDDTGRIVGASTIARDVTDRVLEETRWRLLSEVGTTLDRLLDGERMLRELADLLVREMADYCVTYLVEEDRIRRVGAAHADTADLATLRRIIALAPPRLTDPAGVGAVVRTGEPIHVVEVTADMVAGWSSSPEHLRLIGALAPTSLRVLPLRVRGRTVGAVSLCRTARSKRRYSEADLALGREIAERAALSLDNARLYAEVRSELARREAAEERLRRRFAHLRALYELTHALERATEPDEIHTRALDGLCRGLGAENVALLLVDEANGPRVVASRGLPDGLLCAVERDARGRPLDGDPTPVIVPDVRADRTLDPALREALLETGLRAIALVPIAFGGGRIGAFAVYHERPRVPSGEEMELARAMAGTTAFAIRRLSDARNLSEARDQAERANEAKSQFLGMMSHELRTPLNAVLGYAELLMLETRGPLNTAQREQLERIQVSAMHQLGLVEELLTYTRLEAGREEPRLMEVDARRVVNDVAEFVRPEADAKTLEFETDLSDTPLTVVTDPAKLRQIVLNLAANAVKYTPSGRVSIRASNDADRLLVEVRDTGPGIPEDRFSDIFEPFTRVGDGTSMPTGSGLGLAIARKFASMLDGDVTVRSRVGEGSVFTLRLPARGPEIGSAA